LREVTSSSHIINGVTNDLVSYTVKGARGKVSFDSQIDKYASQLSSDASPEAHLSVFVILEVRCDKYASGEA
jgi:hypothetical protein